MNDKLKHFICGLGVSLTGVFALCWAGIFAAMLTGLLMSATAAASKEYGDYTYGGRFDFWDILATIAGGFTGSALFYVFSLMV